MPNETLDTDPGVFETENTAQNQDPGVFETEDTAQNQENPDFFDLDHDQGVHGNVEDTNTIDNDDVHCEVGPDDENMIVRDPPKIVENEAEDDSIDCDDEHDSEPNDGEVEIADEDVCRPRSLTNIEQSIYGSNQTTRSKTSPPRTRQRSRQETHSSNVLVYYIMTQLSIKQGMRKHGEQAKQSMQEELNQLHTLDAFSPEDVNKLTSD